MLNIREISFSVMLFLGGAAFGAEWIKNGNFENDTTAPWYFSKPNKNASLAIVRDSNLSGGGNGALGITVSDVQRVDLTQRLKVGPGTYKFTARVDTTRCTKSRGFVLIYLAGSVGEKWKRFGTVSTPKKNREDWMKRTGWQKKEWDKHEMIINVPPDGMIKSINIVLGNYVTGTVMLDNISLSDFNEEEQEKARRSAEAAVKLAESRKTAPKAAFLTRKDFNLFRHNETPELGFELENPSGRKVSVQVKFTTIDYFGHDVCKSEKEFLVEAKEKISEILRFPECRLPGFYCVTADWKSGILSGQRKFSFVKVGPVPAKKDPLFGMTFFYDGGLNDLDKLDLLACGSKGVEFRWNWNMHKKTEELAKIKDRLEEFRKRGIEPVGGLQAYRINIRKAYWNRWFAKGKPLDHDPELEDVREEMIKFTEKIVVLCKPYIRAWFLGGEVEGFSQRVPIALPEYIEIIKFVSDTIRRTNPEVEVHGIGIGGFKSSPFFVFMPKILPYVKDHIDGIGPDIYTAGSRYGKGFITLNSEENGFRAGMLKLVEMAKVTRKGFVSNMEGGPSIVRSTPLDDSCAVSMANIVARQFILLKTVPKIRYWQYYKTTNNPKFAADWGMWEKENPRQVVSAYAATARIMAFAEFVKELVLHQDMPCWIFSKDGRYYAAVWYNGKENLKVKLTPGIPVEAKDVQGNPIDLKNGSLFLGEAPVYLYAKDAASLEKLLKNAAENVRELDFEVERQQAGKTILMVKNLSGRVLELNLKSAETGDTDKRIIPYQDRFKLAAGEIKTIEKTIGAEKVTFHLETAKGRKYSASAILRPVPVPLVNSFKDMEKKAVPQLLNDPARQISGYDDLKIHGVYKGLDDLSGSFQLGYDKQYLYLSVCVKDDAHANECVPGQIYSGDSIQFAFDARRDAKMKLMRGIRGYSGDDFNFGSALAKGKPITRCFVAPSVLRGKLFDKNYHLAPEITRDEKTKTTRYRIKIAFEDLAPLKPEKGRNFGFSIVIFDRAPPSEFYNIEYSAGVTHPNDPAKYPAFQFE